MNVPIRIAGVVVVALATVLISSASTPTPIIPPPTLDECTGADCVADYIAFAPEGWTVDLGARSDGTGLNSANPCDVCEDCDGIVIWTFNKPECTARVKGQLYQDSGNGSFLVELDCDGLHGGDTYTDTCDGPFVGHFYCLCIP